MLLLGLLYEDMSWQYIEPQDKENRDALPCVNLQFKDKEKDVVVTKGIQVFSKEVSSILE